MRRNKTKNQKRGYKYVQTSAFMCKFKFEVWMILETTDKWIQLSDTERVRAKVTKAKQNTKIVFSNIPSVFMMIKITIELDIGIVKLAQLTEGFLHMGNMHSHPFRSFTKTIKTAMLQSKFARGTFSTTLRTWRQRTASFYDTVESSCASCPWEADWLNHSECPRE